MKFTVENYLKAKALDFLSIVAHDQANLLDDCESGGVPMSDAFYYLHSKLHKDARKLFQLYPSEGDIEGVKWLRSQGIRA